MFLESLKRLMVAAACLGAGLAAGATISFQTSDLPDVIPGQDLREYVYTISGVTLQANQGIDILFNPATYGTLSNGKAGAGFDLALFQPNVPVGASGDYSALALVNNPSLAGPFSVDFVFLGPGQPGSQPFQINQFDSSGNFLRTISSGFTVAAAVPEPNMAPLAGVSLVLIAVAAGIARRRRTGAGT
jgi:hypothetical protein